MNAPQGLTGHHPQDSQEVVDQKVAEKLYRKRKSVKRMRFAHDMHNNFIIIISQISVKHKSIKQGVPTFFNSNAFRLHPGTAAQTQTSRILVPIHT